MRESLASIVGSTPSFQIGVVVGKKRVVECTVPWQSLTVIMAPWELLQADIVEQSGGCSKLYWGQKLTPLPLPPPLKCTKINIGASEI